MAMTAEEQKVLTDTVEALQALGVVVGVTLAIVNEEMPTFRERALTRLAGTAVTYRPLSTLAVDKQKLLAMAAQFISTLEVRRTS
ncbi:hypothetical protein [Candidatus Binatus sp.]|uniref:hypothetical protein n=1 Tax=Candidatus Binatus sp. TaxID=2811406 RepID=UPI003BAEDFA6